MDQKDHMDHYSGVSGGALLGGLALLAVAGVAISRRGFFGGDCGGYDHGYGYGHGHGCGGDVLPYLKGQYEGKLQATVDCNAAGIHDLKCLVERVKDEVQKEGCDIKKNGWELKDVHDDLNSIMARRAVRTVRERRCRCDDDDDTTTTTA